MTKFNAKDRERQIRLAAELREAGAVRTADEIEAGLFDTPDGSLAEDEARDEASLEIAPRGKKHGPGTEVGVAACGAEAVWIHSPSETTCPDCIAARNAAIASALERLFGNLGFLRGESGAESQTCGFEECDMEPCSKGHPTGARRFDDSLPGVDEDYVTRAVLAGPDLGGVVSETPVRCARCGARGPAGSYVFPAGPTFPAGSSFCGFCLDADDLDRLEAEIVAKEAEIPEMPFEIIALGVLAKTFDYLATAQSHLGAIGTQSILSLIRTARAELRQTRFHLEERARRADVIQSLDVAKAALVQARRAADLKSLPSAYRALDDAISTLGTIRLVERATKRDAVAETPDAFFGALSDQIDALRNATAEALVGSDRSEALADVRKITLGLAALVDAETRAAAPSRPRVRFGTEIARNPASGATITLRRDAIGAAYLFAADGDGKRISGFRLAPEAARALTGS